MRASLKAFFWSSVIVVVSDLNGTGFLGLPELEALCKSSKGPFGSRKARSGFR